MRYVSIFIEAIFMLVFTPVVIIVAGIFQAWDEWQETISRWKRDLADETK